MYNVATEVQTSIRSLCDLILKLKRSALKVTYKPYSADDSRALVQNRIGSKAKAEKELGFSHKYSLEDGLKRLIAWRDATRMTASEHLGSEQVAVNLKAV
jgi:UDP-glucose 4-epimerase